MKNLFTLLILFSMLFFTASCKKEINADAQITRLNPIKSKFRFNKIPASAEQIIIPAGNGYDEIHLFKIDDYYLLDNDMRLSDKQVEFLRKRSSANIETSGAFRNPSSTGDFVKYWSRGVIPFEISSAFSTADRNEILNAISILENNTDLSFVPKQSWNLTYMKFEVDNSNNSYVGVVGTGPQTINLSTNGGVNDFTVIHEIGHSLGLFHEQARTDRDSHIQVHYDNIKNSKEHNFDKYVSRGLEGTDFGPFDFSSIMLYPSFTSDEDFAEDVNSPILSRVNGTTWGFNFFLSTGDINTIIHLYGPPYARIELVNKYYSEDYSGSSTDIYSTDDVYLKLYSDRDCTIPYPGGRDVTVVLKYYESSPPGYFYETRTTITIPSGTNSVKIYEDLNTINYHADYGNVTYDIRRGYIGLNGFFW